MAENRKILIEVVARTSGAEKNLNKVGTQTEKTGQQAQKASKSFLGLGKTFTAIARGFVIVKSFQLLAKAISQSAKTLAEFEFEMAKVRAITGATDEEFARLTKSAKELALGTMFTASEVANLQLAYSKLGFTTQEIEAAAAATLRLATITGDDLGGAADVVGATIRGFGLDASEAARVVDVMAKSFTSSALNLENFKQSMKTIAPIANAANIDLETTTAMLAKLSDAGLRGTRAATGLKNIFMSLTDETSDLAQFLGYTINNSEGALQAFQDLGEEGLNLAVAQGLISKRAAAAFLILGEGVEDVNKLKGALDDATGASNDMADVIENTLTVEVKKFFSAVEGFVLNEGDFMLDFFKKLAKLSTFTLNQMNEEFKIMAATQELQKQQFLGLADSQVPYIQLLETQSILEKDLAKDKQELIRLEKEIQNTRNLAKLTDLRKEIAEYELLTKSSERRLEELGAEIKKRIEYLHSSEQNTEQIKTEIALAERYVNYVKKEGAREFETKAIEEEIKRLKELLKLKGEEVKTPTTEVKPPKEEIDKANRIADAKTKALMRQNLAEAKKGEDDERRFEKVVQAFEENIELVDKLHIKKEEKAAMVADLELKQFNVVQKFIGKLAKVRDEAREDEKEKDEEAAKARFALQMQSVQQAMQYASQLTEIFQTIQQNRLNRMTEENDEQFQLFQEEQERELAAYDAGQKRQLESFVGTQQEKADFEKHLALERIEEEKRLQDAQKALRKKQLAEENKLAKKIFMVDKANTIAQIGVQTALGVAQINANPAVNLDITQTLRTLLTALVVGTGAAQIATVSAQQYTPKTFQDGGSIVGASHSDGGVPFTVAGQAGFEAEGGEYIFSRSTVDRLGTGLLDAINFGGASPRLFADGGSVARKSMESVVMAQADMAEQIGDTIALRITEIPVVNVAQETVDTSRLVENAAAMARL
jgi:TP901 family phage tail tape measure protein